MKFFSKTNLILVVVSCLLVASLYAFVSPQEVKAEDISYNKKIVAVVYDDSGSMDTSRRVDYAKYAMQVLMAMGKLTANELNLAVDIYDAEKYYKETKGKWLSLSID
jgi:hypothetical protein